MYQYEQYDPTDDIISRIDDGKETDKRTDAPSIEELLLTRDEIPLEDRSHQELLNERHSPAAQFLDKIATDTANRVRAINVPGLQGKIERNKWDSLMRKHADFQMDTLEEICPQFVLAMAAALAETKENDEEVQDLLTLKDKDGKRRPKWPNHFSAIHLLIAMAEGDQDFQEVVNLLTDEKGEERFPGHQGATMRLTTAYIKTGQFEKITKILDQLDPRSDILKNEDIFRQYVQALNSTGKFNEVIEKFTGGGKIVAPCKVNNPIITNVANSFNLAGKYQEAYALIRPLLNNWDARESSFFGTVAGIAMGQIGLQREVIRLLADRSGGCKHPGNSHAMRSLTYAFINTGYIREAENLLREARTQDLFTQDELTAMQNALLRKKWPDTARR